MPFANWMVWDRVREFARQNRVYQQERILQDQSNLDRITVGGEFLDFSSQSAILEQTNLQINRLERYKDYEQMDQTGEISLALDLYADEMCLEGNTRIPLLDGTTPTIAELAQKGVDHEFWIYSYNTKTRKYVPVKAHGARISARNQPLVKVMLDDGESVTCTSRHLFMLKDGSYCRAGDLSAGDSLMPLYKKRRYRRKCGDRYCDTKPYSSAAEYDFLFDGSSFRSVHRWVYGYLNTDNPQIVHHRDYNGINNTPCNLDGLTTSEHNEIHCRLGADNPSFSPISLGDIKSAMVGWSGPITKDDVCKLNGIGKRVLKRVLSENGISWNAFKSEYHTCSCGGNVEVGKKVCKNCNIQYRANWHQSKKSDPEYHRRRLLAKRKSYQPVLERICVGCGDSKPTFEFLKNQCSYSPYCNDCRPTFCQKRYQQKSFGNHKVVSVESCGIAEKVYDIEVPEFHCFAAGTKKSWVIVHNSLIDPEHKHSIIIRADDRRIKEELEDLYYNTLLIDKWTRPASRYLCKFGDAPFEIIPDRDRSGVSSIRFMNVYNFTRVETRFGDLIGFFYQDELYPEPLFLHPWSVVHLRLTSFENIYHPYGRAILDGGRKAFKQLRLMEDAALIYRITRAPEKRKYKIPVGLIPPKEVPEYMQIIARMFKRQRFYNPTTGTFDERYSPMVQEDDFFLPQRPDGTGPDIEVLPGAENLDQIADIEYFKKKMVAPLKIPFARVGIGEGSGEANEKSLSQSHAEFAKAVKWIQSEVAIGLQKIGIVHLALRGYGVDAIKGFEIALASSSALEDLYRMETWQTRVAVMAELKDIGWFPKEWIVSRFTDLSPDEIEELEEMEEEETGGGIGGAGGPMDMGDEDMGGEEGDLEDLEDMGDEDMGGGEDEEDVLAAPDEDEDALEGYDADREKRIIMEEIKMRKRRKKKEFMQRQWDKRNTPRSSFDYLVEMKELDGLSTGSKSNPSSRNGKPVGSMPHNPNSDDGLLVEWSVGKKAREEAITEIASLLRSGTVDQDDTKEPGEISDSDLPPPVQPLSKN